MLRQLTILLITAGFVHSGPVEIAPPLGWQEQTGTPPTVEKLFALKVDPGEFSPNVAISRYKLPCCREGETTIDSLMARVKYTQERTFPLYKISEKEKRKINGINGAFFMISYAKGDLDIVAFQYFFLQGDEFVNVVYMCLLKDLERFRPEIEKSLATLKLSGKADTVSANKSSMEN